MVLAFHTSPPLDIDPIGGAAEAVVARRLPFGRAYGLHVKNSVRCWSLFHDAYCVTLVTAGHGRWRYRRRDADIAPHSLMIAEPGEVHTTTAVTSPCDFHALFFEPALLREILRVSTSFEPHFKLVTTRHPELVHGFQTACSMLEAGAEEGAQKELFSRSIVRLFEHAGETRPQRHALPTTAVRKAARVLRERYEDAPRQRADIASVSTEVGLSYHWLVHSFTAEYGIAPYQYVQALRLAKMRAILSNGPTNGLRSLSDIARAIGFTDKSHLHRSVKRAFGISPWQLARQLDPRW